VFTVSRWYAPGEVNETGRMVSLAVAALYDMGVAEPAGHIFLASSRRIATLIVSKPPLSASSTETLRGVSNELGFDILLSPGSKPQSTVLRQIVESSSREALEAYTGSLERDLTPATDERPFFFNQLPLYDPLRTIQTALHRNSDGVNRGNILATATLALLFLLSTMLALATIIMPLRPAIRDIGRRLAFGGTMYFLLIGIGFMCVEIGLLQRLTTKDCSRRFCHTRDARGVCEPDSLDSRPGIMAER
jgi:hypothetical protein